jgi:putative ABC transport system substrate-binding protein
MIDSAHGTHRHTRDHRAETRRGLRTVVLLLALGALVAPLAAEAPPQGKIPQIGYLTDSVAPRSDVEEFQRALRDIGYVEGHNIVFVLRFADKPDQYATFAAELAGLKVDVIVVRRGFMALAAKQATQTIPIVMATSGDAAGEGLVASLARPGGNVTGLTFSSPDQTQKRLALLKEAVPELARVAFLRCPTVAGQPNPLDKLEWRGLQGAANLLGLHLQSLDVRHPDDLEVLFEAAVRERADALMTQDCVYLNTEPTQRQIGSLAAKYRLPGISPYRDYVVAGGLMVYTAAWGGSRWHRITVYVDKILKGAQPADLPVEQPMHFFLIINLKTAQALGITIPPSLLVLANEVIH